MEDLGFFVFAALAIGGFILFKIYVWGILFPADLKNELLEQQKKQAEEENKPIK